MKNRNIWLVFAILAAACVLFAGCKNPVMEKWWDVEKPAPAVTPPPAYHTVLFSADGGLPAPGIQQIAHGGKLVKILPMAKAHHAFGGWFRDAEFNSEWVFERDPVNNDVILYAKWVTVADVSVTFEANGGSPPPEAQSLIKDAKVVEPPPMSKPGSGFGGWYINLAAGTKYDFTIGRAVEDLTLYAKWEDNPALVFTVTFNAEGGAPPPIDQQIINGGQIVEPLPMS
ncbi:MAG: InlB B-repeat-containing protein, partial [Treponema sp.]|nr:InlB B-repeat-containing protein [Treponema sp.]